MRKKGLSRVRKPKAFSLSCGGVVVKAVVLKAYKERESIPTLGPRLLNNLKVSWPKSERKKDSEQLGNLSEHAPDKPA